MSKWRFEKSSCGYSFSHFGLGWMVQLNQPSILIMHSYDKKTINWVRDINTGLENRVLKNKYLYQSALVLHGYENGIPMRNTKQRGHFGT